MADLILATNQIIGFILMQIPDPGPQKPPGTGGVDLLLGWLKWIGYAIAGGAIIVGGILVAVALGRGDGRDALPKLLWPCVGVLIIGGGIGMVSSLIGA